jgi:hypothetical protein
VCGSGQCDPTTIIYCQRGNITASAPIFCPNSRFEEHITVLAAKTVAIFESMEKSAAMREKLPL